MYNLIEYSNNYSKTSGNLWQYCKEMPAIDDDGNIVNFKGANATDSFNFKTKITVQTAADNNNGNIAGRVDVDIMVPLNRVPTVLENPGKSWNLNSVLESPGKSWNF